MKRIDSSLSDFSANIMPSMSFRENCCWQNKSSGLIRSKNTSTCYCETQLKTQSFRTFEGTYDACRFDGTLFHK